MMPERRAAGHTPCRAHFAGHGHDDGRLSPAHLAYFFRRLYFRQPESEMLPVNFYHDDAYDFDIDARSASPELMYRYMLR